MRKDLYRMGSLLLAATIAASNPLLVIADENQGMTITVDAQNNYPGPDMSSLVVTGHTGTYDGLGHVISATIGDGSTITYSKDGITYRDTPYTVKDVADSGIYYIKAAINEKSSFITETVNITKKEATISAVDSHKIFGKDDPEFTATVTGAVNGETLNYSVVRTDPNEAVGVYTDVLSVNPGSNPNYEITTEKGDFEIVEDVLSDFSVSDYNAQYDGQSHGITVTGVDAPGTVVEYSTDGANWTTTAPTIKDIGTSETYTVRATNGENVKTGTGKIVVSKRDVTITADNASKKRGDADPTFTATVTGNVTGETLNYTVTRTNSDESIGVYEDVLTVTPGENPNFNVTTGTGNFEIVKNDFDTMKDHVDIIGYSGTYDGNSHLIAEVEDDRDSHPEYTIEYSTDGGNTWTDDTSSDSMVKNVADSGTYKVKLTLNGESYIKDVDVSITKKNVVITVQDAEKDRGTSDPTYSVSVEGNVAGDALNYTVIRTNADVELPGTYNSVLDVILGDNPNYTFTVHKGNFVIHPKTLAFEGSYQVTVPAVVMVGFNGTAVAGEADIAVTGDFKTGDFVNITVDSGSIDNARTGDSINIVSELTKTRWDKDSMGAGKLTVESVGAVNPGTYTGTIGLRITSGNYID